MTEAQKDTVGWGGARGRSHTWSDFDALPRQIKALYWYAPYDYTAQPAVEAFQAGMRMGDNLIRQRRAFDRDMRREIIRAYGRTHPQIARLKVQP